MEIYFKGESFNPHAYHICIFMEGGSSYKNIKSDAN